mgnify:CR=1 FL=1
MVAREEIFLGLNRLRKKKYRRRKRQHLSSQNVVVMQTIEFARTVVKSSLRLKGIVVTVLVAGIVLAWFK